MENTPNNQEGAATSSHSNTIFGVSSDDIVQDLHSGNLADVNEGTADQEYGDKEQIVNAQDQQEIVNPIKDDTEVITTNPGGFTNPGGSTADLTRDELNTGETRENVIPDETDSALQKPGSDKSA